MHARAVILFIKDEMGQHAEPYLEMSPNPPRRLFLREPGGRIHVRVVSSWDEIHRIKVYIYICKYVRKGLFMSLGSWCVCYCFHQVILNCSPVNPT